MDLYELRDRVLTLPTLERRMALVSKDVREADMELARLFRQYKQESRDVELLKEKSLTGFLLGLIGKYEDRLEKEQNEEIAAKLAYDRAAVRFESLREEREALAARIADLQTEEKTYQAELAKRRSKLADNLAEPAGIQLAELENERKAIVSMITEIREAQSAASRAAATAERAHKSLESAGRWATYDVLGGDGIISHMAKYSHIDSAERDFHQLSSQLRSLKSELSDVRGMSTSGLNEISSGQRTIDFWFDNIFTDLSVRGQIKNNAAEVGRLLSSIRSAESALKTKLDSENKKLAENRRREEELLLSSGVEE